MGPTLRVRTTHLLYVFAGVVCATGVLASGPPEHINQISGTVRLTNENPLVLQRLSGLREVGVTATSQANPPFQNYFLAPFAEMIEFPYSIDVATTETGLAYSVSAVLNMIPSSAYLFQDRDSSPVFPEPVPDAVVDVEECVGLIDVTWRDSNGDPISPSIGQVRAFPEIAAGEFRSWAQAEMRPGYMTGEIELVGPPGLETGSCLADLQVLDDRDDDGDGIPDAFFMAYSAVFAHGDQALAPGATRSASGGYAQGGFGGNWDESTHTFRASYELALAGLFGEASFWQPPAMRLTFLHRPDPEGAIDLVSSISVSHRDAAQLIVPRQTTPNDLRHCLGQVNLEIRSRVPGQLANTSVWGSQSTDPGDPGYWVSGFGREDSTCSWGGDCPEENPHHVVLCLPQGSYTLHSWLRSYVTGTRSYEIPLTVEVGCRQNMSLSADLGVELEPIQECAAGDIVDLSGSVYSTYPVQRIYYRLNDGPEVELCSDCGEDPSLSAQVPDSACANRIDVVAVDLIGNEASLSAAFDCLLDLNTDLDDVMDCSDCAPGDDGVWSLPAEVSGLRLNHAADGGITTLTWDELEETGALSASYLVTTRAGDTCIGSDVGAATSMTDEQVPSPGALLEFFVGALNGCGLGSLGADSTGALRPSCP